MSSNAIVRTVSVDERRNKKRARASRAMPVSMGLRRYLRDRGTPAGSYEFNRTVTGVLNFTNAGLQIGAARYAAGTWTVSPQNLKLVSGVAGNTNTYPIINAAEFAALFDKIKVDKVEFTFTSNSPGQLATSPASIANLLLFAEDDNDTTTSPDQIRQMNCKTWQPGYNANSFKMTIRPKYQRIVYYTALVSSYEPASGYVVSDTDIPHYGLKMGVDTLSDSSMLVNFTAKVFFKCKEIK